MRTNWEARSKILSNLLNPAFCGEVLKRFIMGYNENSNSNASFAHILIVLPLVLSKTTREALPKTTKSYLFSWVDDNEHLLIDFSKKVNDLMPYSKEAIMFLMLHGKLTFDSSGNIFIPIVRRELFKGEDNVNEVNEILKKSEFLGKWFAKTDVKSLYSFFRIIP